MPSDLTTALLFRCRLPAANDGRTADGRPGDGWRPSGNHDECERARLVPAEEVGTAAAEGTAAAAAATAAGRRRTWVTAAGRRRATADNRRGTRAGPRAAATATAGTAGRPDPTAAAATAAARTRTLWDASRTWRLPRTASQLTPLLHSSTTGTAAEDRWATPRAGRARTAATRIWAVAIPLRNSCPCRRTPKPPPTTLSRSTRTWAATTSCRSTLQPGAGYVAEVSSRVPYTHRAHGPPRLPRAAHGPPPLRALPHPAPIPPLQGDGGVSLEDTALRAAAAALWSGTSG